MQPKNCYILLLAPLAFICLAAGIAAAGEPIVTNPEKELRRLRDALPRAKTEAACNAIVNEIAALNTAAAAEFLASIVKGTARIPKDARKANVVRAAGIAALVSINVQTAKRVHPYALVDPADVVRATAVSVWDRLPGHINLDRVTAFFNDESPLPQVEAVRLLGRLQRKRCRELLLAQLENKHAEVRAAVLESIMQWRGELDLLKLRKPLFEDPDTRVRIAAVELIARDADEDAVEMLVDTFVYDAQPQNGEKPEYPNLDAARVNEAVLDALAGLPAEVADPVLVGKKLKRDSGLTAFRRGLVIRAVGMRRSNGAIEPLAVLLAEDKAENQEFAAAALGDIGDPLAEEPLFAYFKDGAFDSKLAALDALTRLKSLKRIPDMIRISKTYRWELKLFAIRVLGAHPTPESIERLAEALSEKPWQIRVAAVRALRAAWKKECIEPLIKALGDASGRLRAEILDALWDYTQDVRSESAAEWRPWWKRVKKNYTVPVARVATRPEFVAPKAYSESKLFGRRIDSDRVTVILDISSSMWEKSASSNAVPMKPAQKEIGAFIKKLSKRTQFNLIAMGKKPRSWCPHLARATANSRVEARAFLQKVDKADYADFDAALDIALSDPDSDTIVIITSAPSAGASNESSGSSPEDPRLGRYANKRYFLQKLHRRNRTAYARIIVFCFGKKDSFLEALAAENSGMFVPVEER
ncbi:MAG: hypothetical protein E3J72_08000 [Planctomycetota bacterium]|nr:MAG: hypothetical protein E3J72_08000 [Planctomycetota bacterium]